MNHNSNKDHANDTPQYLINIIKNATVTQYRDSSVIKREILVPACHTEIFNEVVSIKIVNYVLFIIIYFISNTKDLNDEPSVKNTYFPP